MAERREFLDRLTPDVREHVRQIGSDPDFVDFVLGWYGLLRMDSSEREVPPITTWPYWSTSRQRQEKRKLKRSHGPAWKKDWEHIKALARSYEPPRFKAGLFSIDPQGPKPAHGPFRWNFWLALCDVKNYFTRIAKRPHWDLIAEVFFPGQAFGYAQAEWAKRKGRFSKIDPDLRLNRLRTFYERFNPVILEVLMSRVPMWASPHREHFERLCAEAGLMTIFQTIFGGEPVGHKVPQQSVASEGKDPSQSKRSRTKQPPTRTRTVSRRRRSRV
jgi:hypothetical protein